jgi:hypothetical protein
MRHNFPAGGAQVVQVLFEAGGDIVLVRDKFVAKAMHVGFASLLSLLAGGTLRGRET